MDLLLLLIPPNSSESRQRSPGKSFPSWIHTDFTSQIIKQLFNDILDCLVSTTLDDMTSESSWIDHLERLKWIIWSAEFGDLHEDMEKEDHSNSNGDDKSGAKQTLLGKNEKAFAVLVITNYKCSY